MKWIVFIFFPYKAKKWKENKSHRSTDSDPYSMDFDKYGNGFADADG